eukprot:s1740_g10.t1
MLRQWSIAQDVLEQMRQCQVTGNIITKAMVSKLGLNRFHQGWPLDGLVLAVASGRYATTCGWPAEGRTGRGEVGGSTGVAMTPKPQEDHYQVLGVDCNVSDSDLTKAYKKLALKYHPDKSDQHQDNSSGESFKRITEAYNVLHDPEQRKCYDDQRDAQRAFHQGSKSFELREFCDFISRQPGKEKHAFRHCTTKWSCEDLNLEKIYRAVNTSGDGQPKRHKPAGPLCTKQCTIPENTAVVLHSFQKSLQHNGCEARVSGFDERTGRYNLVMEGCCSFAVKPENMTQKCSARIHGLSLHPHLNGKDVKIVGFDEAGRYLVCLPNSNAVFTLKPGNAILKAGTCVRLQGLSPPDLNGKMALICEVDLDTDTYSVECADGRQVRVRYENVVC